MSADDDIVTFSCARVLSTVLSFFRRSFCFFGFLSSFFLHLYHLLFLPFSFSYLDLLLSHWLVSWGHGFCQRVSTAARSLSAYKYVAISSQVSSIMRQGWVERIISCDIHASLTPDTEEELTTIQSPPRCWNGSESSLIDVVLDFNFPWLHQLFITVVWFNLLYSFHTYSVPWCFLFLRSSISKEIPLVIHGLRWAEGNQQLLLHS